MISKTRLEERRFRSQLLTWAKRAETAVDPEDLAGDPMVFRVEEPGNGGGDIVRLADAAEGVHGGGGFEGGFARSDLGGQGRIDETRGDAVNANVARSVGGGSGEREADDAAFGGGDGFVIGESGAGGGSGAEDDGTAGGHHGFGAGANRGVGRGEVGVDGLAPLGFGGEVSGFQEYGSGAVDDPGKGSESTDGSFDLFGNDGVDGLGGGAKFASQGLERGGVAAEQKERGSAGRQTTGEGGPDAAGGSDDYDVFHC